METKNILLIQIIDVVLLIIENLLAFRVVFSYLGTQSTFIHQLTGFILFPIGGLVERFSYAVDTSRLDVISVILVILLFYIHRYLDKYMLSAEELA